MKSLKIVILTFILVTVISACKNKKSYDETLTKELVVAVYNKNLETTRSLLSRNANPNAIDADGKPVIMGVLLKMKISSDDFSSGVIRKDQSESETVQVVKLLLDAGADPNAIDKEGIPIMEAAFTRGDENIVAHLIKAGASIKGTDATGNSLIVLATFTGNIKIVQLMLDAGANVNEKSKNDATALLAATFKRYSEISRLLIQKGANVNARVDVGTPLIYAAGSGDLELVKLLIEKGADVNAKDDENTSPLSAAQRRKNQEVVKFLIAAGAKP